MLSARLTKSLGLNVNSPVLIAYRSNERAAHGGSKVSARPDMLLTRQSEATLAPVFHDVEGAAVAARAAARTVAISVHDNIEAVAEIWRGFEQDADCTGFQRLVWHAAWQRNIGDRAGVRPAIAIGRVAGRVVAIVPLAVVPGGVRRLVWHASDLCDYNAPLLAAEFVRLAPRPAYRGLLADVIRAVAAHPGLAFDAVEFTKMPETVGGQPNPFMALPTTLNPSGAHRSSLFGEWDSFYSAKRSSATRRRDRTKRKRLADCGEVRFVEPVDAGEIRDTLTTLMAQKSQAFARMGVPDLFERPGYRDFYLDLAADPENRGFVHVSRLDVGGRPAAVNFGLVSGGAYCHVLASYDNGEVARFGPGAAHLHELIAHAIARGCTVFDFTIGDERYKREWSDEVLALHDYHGAATLKGWAVTLPSILAVRTRRLIKQTPALWRAAVALRSLVARLTRRRAAPAEDAAD
jgi:CelD/BcsL family acetyltransferase involved in cellulose biosynthesis